MPSHLLPTTVKFHKVAGLLKTRLTYASEQNVKKVFTCNLQRNAKIQNFSKFQHSNNIIPLIGGAIGGERYTIT